MTQPFPVPDDVPSAPVADLSGDPLDDVDEDELLDLYKNESGFDGTGEPS